MYPNSPSLGAPMPKMPYKWRTLCVQYFPLEAPPKMQKVLDQLNLPRLEETLEGSKTP